MKFAKLFLLVSTAAAAFAAEPAPRYETRTEHDPNGIGVFYMGREIAHVMGHLAANWLERPERDEEERTDLLIDSLKFREGEVVADIGCGSGYIARKIARKIGEHGVIYGVDIQQEMLDLLMRRMAMFRIGTVKPILGTITDPKLPPASCDTMIMVDVYHEFDHPFEMLQAMTAALKPGGRIVFVEFRGEDPEVPIKAVHKMSEAQVKKEMTVQPLEFVETLEVLPRQHILIFRKPPGVPLGKSGEPADPTATGALVVGSKTGANTTGACCAQPVSRGSLLTRRPAP